MLKAVKLFSKLSSNVRISRMASNVVEESTVASPDNKCLFCGIINENSQEKIVYQDDEIVAFADIKPASKNHFLIVPKRHIINAQVLQPEDRRLVEKLVVVGKKVLEHRRADLSDTRYGFHWPPFVTVPHLHLHAISPASEMNFLSRLIFKQDSYWFVSADHVISRL